MGSGLDARTGQVAFEIEAVEGTAETLVAADATMLAYEPDFKDDLGFFTREPNRATYSKLDSIPGIKAARMTWKTELKGSGSVSTPPAWDDVIRCCGFIRSAVSRIAIGAVTSGPFIPGETVTGGNSGATGRVVGEIRNGDSYVYFVPISGTWESAETITGGTSGASATTSGTETTDQGYEWRPLSGSTVPSGTGALYMDGVKKLLYGARGNAMIECVAGEPVFLGFEVEGVYGGVTDVALLSPTYESTIPIAFLNTQASLHELEAIFTQLSLNMQNVLSRRTSARSANGILSVKLTDRNPVGSIDPEMELVADHDFYGRHAAGTVGRVYAELPSSNAGEKITIAAPRVQYMNLAEGEQDRRAILNIDLELKTAGVSAGDDELQIGMY